MICQWGGGVCQNKVVLWSIASVWKWVRKIQEESWKGREEDTRRDEKTEEDIGKIRKLQEDAKRTEATEEKGRHDEEKSTLSFLIPAKYYFQYWLKAACIIVIINESFFLLTWENHLKGVLQLILHIHII